MSREGDSPIVFWESGDFFCCDGPSEDLQESLVLMLGDSVSFLLSLSGSFTENGSLGKSDGKESLVIEVVLGFLGGLNLMLTVVCPNLF